GLSAWLVFLPSAVWDRRAVLEPKGTTGAELPCRPSRWSEVLSLIPLSYLIIVIAYTGTGLVLRGTPHFGAPVLIERLARDLHFQEGRARLASRGFCRVSYVVPWPLTDGSEMHA